MQPDYKFEGKPLLLLSKTAFLSHCLTVSDPLPGCTASSFNPDQNGSYINN